MGNRLVEKAQRCQLVLRVRVVADVAPTLGIDPGCIMGNRGGNQSPEMDHLSLYPTTKGVALTC
jgi:hypothetical protein